MPKAPRWEAFPQQDDFAAGARELSLLLVPGRASSLATALSHSPTVQHRANDLLRASGLGLLPADDAEVAKDLKKVEQGEKLSPILLVRGALGEYQLTVADGYHRICASYHLDPDTEIPCCVGDLVG